MSKYLLAPLVLSFSALAQPFSDADSVNLSAATVATPQSTQAMAPASGPVASMAHVLPAAEQDLPPPFGANLFVGGYEANSIDGVNADYRIATGDKIAIWLWGAVSVNDVAVVDAQGNIFIPEIGPVTVSGERAGDLHKLVEKQIKRIYTQDVETYVNVLTATPVSVFVTGPVLRPGQYAGISSDGLLAYLKRAGGIDSERGSYRHISVQRNGETITTFDLYDFLLKGTLPNIQFRDRDVIVVGQQGATVVVEGGARNPFRFEFANSKANGQELVTYARPLAKVSHVGVQGNRETGPFSVYLDFDKFEAINLHDGDTVFFKDDLHAQIMNVRLQGEYLGPSFYTVNKGTKLHDFLNHIAVSPEESNYQSIYIKRKSVAAKQKEMLDQSLDRLERSVFTAPASSDGEAVIRAKEAALVSEFVMRARQIQPEGKVIVSDNGHVANVRLEQGDVVVIPKRSDLINIGGEVLMPQAVVFNPNATLNDYVAWAGGFTERGDAERIAVVHANGMVSFNSYDNIKPGDQVLVLPYIDSKNMQLAKDITQIVYQIAVAANVII
ncbi:polysaccharide biosynthesis/export family protein [Enterovibrio norvegicus]|uniref:polysaccharide biosynthesis/export family protein n=1 Tax=Enterovibrio norvegicus TaxID=188144 RepID=UPI00352DAD6A